MNKRYRDPGRICKCHTCKERGVIDAPQAGEVLLEMAVNLSTRGQPCGFFTLDRPGSAQRIVFRDHPGDW